jgi:hypothetical protein
MTVNTQTYSRTPTDVVRAADGIDFAYRRRGNRDGTPLILANYASNVAQLHPAHRHPFG